jgi:hypothetical protein
MIRSSPFGCATMTLQEVLEKVTGFVRRHSVWYEQCDAHGPKCRNSRVIDIGDIIRVMKCVLADHNVPVSLTQQSKKDAPGPRWNVNSTSCQAFAGACIAPIHADQ